MKIATQPGVNPLDTLSAHTENIAAQTRQQTRQQRAAFRDTRLRFARLYPIDDGEHQQAAANAAWATIRGAASGTFISGSGTVAKLRLKSDTTTDQWDDMYRLAWYFDTEGVIRTESIIHAARVIIRAESVTDNFGSSIVLCAADADNDPPPPNSGYADYGSVDFGVTRPALADLTADRRFSIQLNKAGLDHLNVGGVTALGLRFDGDFDNVEPTWQSGVVDEVQIGALHASTPAELELEYYY